MRVLQCAVLLALIGAIVCPPVTTPKPVEKPKAKDEGKDDDVGMDTIKKQGYDRYLKEVMSVLVNDEEMQKRLSQVNDMFVESGDIAHHLEFVNHRVRTQLDEIKRREVDRLNQIRKLLIAKQQQGEGGAAAGKRIPGMPNLPAQVLDAVLKQQGLHKGIHPDTDHTKLLHHIDHKNPETFEVDDLKKLIQKATSDLEEIDKERKKEFKQYEMEKEHLRKEKLKQLDETHRREEEKRFEEQKKKHKEHPKLHHPGHKAQYVEVWEEDDGLDPEDFNPKTFFYMHDTNGDKVLDEEEVEALFQRELDKAYDPDADEDDMIEREEEMNRMREHVFTEVDKNGDRQIDLQEFMDSTRAEDFDQDEPWDTLDDEDQYTDEELEQFEREYEERRRQMFDGNVQPGEINVPHVVPSQIPGQDGVAHMNQQQGAGAGAAKPADQGASASPVTGSNDAAPKLPQGGASMPKY